VAEVNVVNETKTDSNEATRWFGLDAPLIRGSLSRLDPIALMRQFTEDMDRYFNPIRKIIGDESEWRPAIEVKQTDGKLLVIADLPGVKMEDVKVNIDGGTLVVEGERREEKEENREGYYHSERRYGKFHRLIPLPQGAKTGEAAAQFSNGVLEVSVPVEKKTAKTEVPVKKPTIAKAA
jgi:HSP20 family protein